VYGKNEGLQLCWHIRRVPRYIKEAIVEANTNPWSIVMAHRSIQPVLEACELLYDAFAPRFKRDVPRPVITIQTKGRTNAMAWFGANRWKNGHPAALPEINICAEYINQGLDETSNSILHEMVHYANWLDRIRDCSASQYHNCHFKSRCELVGLICRQSSQRRYGWAETELSDELRSLVRSLTIDQTVFELFRIAPMSPPRRHGSKMKKWRCKCTNIRAAVVIDASCNRFVTRH